MAEYETQIDVVAAPQIAFDYLADFVNVAEWDPSVRAAKPLGEGPPALGSSYVITTGFYGKAIDLVCETTTLDAPSQIGLRVDGGLARGHVEIAVRPRDSGSTVTYHVDMELKGVAKVFDKGLQLALDGMGENAVDGLRARLSSV